MQLQPLDSQHLQCCNKVLQETPAALELAQACIDCGFPAEDLKQQLEDQHKQAAAIKAKFFPTTP
jgi:hypothetical protein